jgi:hypothetical protein
MPNCLVVCTTGLHHVYAPRYLGWWRFHVSNQLVVSTRVALGGADRLSGAHQGFAPRVCTTLLGVGAVSSVKLSGDEAPGWQWVELTDCLVCTTGLVP